MKHVFGLITLSIGLASWGTAVHAQEPAAVAEAVRAVRPWAVDVSSGVETARGIKDAQKIIDFVAGVRNADAGPSL